MHHQMGGTVFCTSAARETSFLPCRACETAVRAGSRAAEIMDLLTRTLFTPNQSSPALDPHLRPCWLAVTLPSAVTQAGPTSLLTNRAENSHAQSGGSPQGAPLSNLSTNQTEKHYGKRRAERVCRGWGGCQGLMGADGRQGSPLNIFELLTLLSTALVPVCYELRQLGFESSPPSPIPLS